MKWFMCINDNSIIHQELSKIAVLSAIKNTTLEPYLIYAGCCDEYSSWMKSKGVTVFYKTLSYIEELRRCGKERRSIGSGAFLRTDIPSILKSSKISDKYVLYTDSDVIFLKDPPAIHPEYFACGPEFSRDETDFVNTGVMYMNVHSMHYTYDSFKEYIVEHIDKNVSYDQVMYNGFYNNMWDQLSAELNWKPYWGYNEEAVILHWHGPKPGLVSQMKNMSNPENYCHLYALWQRSLEGYDKYLEIWDSLSKSV
jgi:hypothetical protein